MISRFVVQVPESKSRLKLGHGRRASKRRGSKRRGSTLVGPTLVFQCILKPLAGAQHFADPQISRGAWNLLHESQGPANHHQPPLRCKRQPRNHRGSLRDSIRTRRTECTPPTPSAEPVSSTGFPRNEGLLWESSLYGMIIAYWAQPRIWGAQVGEDIETGCPASSASLLQARREAEKATLESAPRPPTC